MNDFGIPGITRAVPYTSGGSSVIYEAWQEDFDRRVAVKVLRGPVAEKTQRSFQRERHAAGRLTGHPGILDVYAGGVTDTGELYLIMPFIEGGSLQSEVNQAGPFALPKAVKDVIAVAEALEFAHRQGVIHRDIKPANILRDKSGQPLIADFGIARLLDSEVATSTVTANTPLFAAPELLSDHAATASSDVYSLGALLYALLAGRPAFSGAGNDNIWTIMDRVRMDEPAAIAGVPVQVMDVIRSAMAKTPVNRPTSASLFAQYLRFAMHEATRNPRPGHIRTRHQLVLPSDTPGRNRASTHSAPGYVLTPRPELVDAARPAPRAPRPKITAPALSAADWRVPAVAGMFAILLLGIGVWGLVPRFGNDSASADVSTETAISDEAPVAVAPTATPIPEPTTTPAPIAEPTKVPPTTVPLQITISTPTPVPEPTEIPVNFLSANFDAKVPDEWSTRKNNVDVGYGYRSEFRAESGSDFLIVDTTPKDRAAPGVSIEQSAYYVAGNVSSASPVQYEKIGEKDAWWFSFTGNDGSQRIDIFFEVDGVGYAVIGGSYGDPAGAFEAAREFVRSVNNN